MVFRKKTAVLSLLAFLIVCGLTAESAAARPLQAAGTAREDLLRQAIGAENAGDLPRAAGYYVDYLKQHPENAEVNQRLGLVYYLTNRYKDAVAPFRQAQKLDPKLWPSALFLGICLYRLGEFEKAVAPLERSLQLKPGLPEGDFWLGSTLSALGRDEEAIERLQEVPSGTLVSVEANYLLVKLYRKMAEAYYLKLEKAAPDSGRVHQLVAENLIWRNRDLEAIDEYRIAIARQPALLGLHRMIGDLYWHEHKLEEARKEYEQELRLDPLSDISNLRLGQYWLSKGDMERGAKYIEFALKLNKNLSEANRDLGQVWLARGDLAKGESLLKKAAEQNPDDPLTHRLLATLYSKTNRPELAEKEEALFKKLTAAAPQEPQTKAQ